MLTLQQLAHQIHILTANLILNLGLAMEFVMMVPIVKTVIMMAEIAAWTL